jgi:hypothetical protein
VMFDATSKLEAVRLDAVRLDVNIKFALENVNGCEFRTVKELLERTILLVVLLPKMMRSFDRVIENAPNLAPV